MWRDKYYEKVYQRLVEIQGAIKFSVNFHRSILSLSTRRFIIAMY